VTQKTITTVRCRIVIFDDPLNSTSHARDRQCAILQVVHRAQAGRFETRWNQADVHACLNQVRHFLVIIFLVGKLRWKFSGCDRKRSFKGSVAFAENDQANIVPKQAIEERHQDFETFFLDYATYHSENWTARSGREVNLLQKRLTTDFLSTEAFRIVARGKQTIGCGIPARVIYAV